MIDYLVEVGTLWAHILIIRCGVDLIGGCGAVEKPLSDSCSMGQSLIFVSQHGQTSLTVAPLVVNLDFFNSPAVSLVREII